MVKKIPSAIIHFGYCDVHRKRRYFTRKGAKAAIRRRHDKGVMREYRCTYANGWHLGHIPPVVRSGEKTADEVYGPERTRREDLS